MKRYYFVVRKFYLLSLGIYVKELGLSIEVPLSTIRGAYV
mgnify:CR=1 FL=1